MMNTWEKQKSDAYLFFSRKDYATARSILEKILKEQKGQIDDKEYHLLACDYATTLLFSGQKQEAIQTFLLSLNYFQSRGNIHQSGLIYGNLGTAYEMTHRYGEAEKSFEKAIQSIEQDQAREEYYLCLKSLALVKVRMGKLKQAVWIYVRAIEGKPQPSLLEKALLSMIHLVLH